MKVSSQIAVAALASIATATSVNVHKRETPLSVKLVASGNSEVKVTLTNNGEKTLNLLSKGTFLDEQLPVEKVEMYSAGGSKSDSYYQPQDTILSDSGLIILQVSRFPSRA
jgi:deuterolysin